MDVTSRTLPIVPLSQSWSEATGKTLSLTLPLPPVPASKAGENTNGTVRELFHPGFLLDLFPLHLKAIPVSNRPLLRNAGGNLTNAKRPLLMSR